MSEHRGIRLRRRGPRKGEPTTEKARREELSTQFKQTRPEAGVYRIVNVRANNALLDSTPNLESVQNRLAFAGLPTNVQR